MRPFTITVLLWVAASVAAAALIAMRVETEPLGSVGDDTAVAITVQVSPEDRSRLGDTVWVSGELKRGSLSVDDFEVSVKVGPEGTVSFEKQWPPGSYQLRVDIESLSTGDTGFWKGRLRVPQMQTPAAVPEVEAEPAESEVPPAEPDPAAVPPPAPLSESSPVVADAQATSVAVPGSASSTDAEPTTQAAPPPVPPAEPVAAEPARATDAQQASRPGLAQLTVIVSDGKNRAINTLRRADFNVSVAGKPVVVEEFEGPGSPLILGIALDRSNTMEAHMPEVRRTLGRMAAQADASGGGSFFVTLDGDTVNTHGSGTETGEFDPALVRAESAPEGNIAHLVGDGLAAFGPSIGRRILMVVVDGGDIASRAQWKTTLDLVKTAGVPVFVVAFDAGDLKSRTLDRLRKVAYSSGGRVYILRDTQLLKMTADFYRELIEASYTLRFAAAPGRTGKISVQAGQGFEVHHSTAVRVP